MRAALLLLTIAACTMYGDPPATLLDPPRTHPKGGVATVEPPPAIPYDEDCSTDFHRDPHQVRRKPAVAQQKVGEGDATLATAQKQTAEAARTDLVVRGIGQYSDALRADPYDADATLRLALAYDKVLRKGCALAMLRRLESLTQNPQLANSATRTIDDVVDNRSWFKGYRKDALQAVNRSGSP